MSGSITISQLRTGLSRRSQLIDVRSASEFAARHIPGAVNIPMDQIEARLSDLSAEDPIVLVCKSGTRARMTAELLVPCQRETSVLEGGTDAWIAARLPTVSTVKTRWSLERQVRLGAGLLVTMGVVLALTVNSHWIFLSAFVGLGLTFAGITDFCPMGELLARLPWNGKSHCNLGTSKPAPHRTS